jgi:hypothetical protein
MQGQNGGRGQKDDLSWLKSEVSVRQDVVFKAVRQLSLLHSGMQRCRKMKMNLKAEEHKLQKQLEILNTNSSDPATVIAKKKVVADLLGNGSR